MSTVLAKLTRILKNDRRGPSFFYSFQITFAKVTAIQFLKPTKLFITVPQQ